MTTHLTRAASAAFQRALTQDHQSLSDPANPSYDLYHPNGTEIAGLYGDDDGHGGGHSDFGVHIQYEELYAAIIFFACIYVAGQIASRLLRMPSLVGEIVAGILLGPPLADFVPNPPAWVLFGEIGYVSRLKKKQ